MKKIIAFLMAVVFVMSGFAVISAYAYDTYDHVNYYNNGVLGAGQPIGWIITYGDDDWNIGEISYHNVIYDHMHCFMATSQFTYSDLYRNLPGTNDNSFCLYVETTYSIMYAGISDPERPTQTELYRADGRDLPHTVVGYYNASQTVTSISIYHKVNTTDMHINNFVCYNSSFSSYIGTATYFYG